VRAEFGPFLADADRGELFKHGARLRLRAQPFRVLMALLEKPGERVTREELRRRLWGEHTFAEFDVGINSAVSRLREVLGDSRHVPRLIETLPKRGYRFIGPVSLWKPSGKPAPASQRKNSEAHQAYLKGHHLIKRHTPSNAERALEYFREAIRLEPNEVLPYHGAALYYLLAALMGELRPREALTEAEDLITRGRMIDEHSAMLQNTLAMLRMFQWRWEESEAAFRRAIELEPDNPHVRMMYSHLCCFRGRREEAVQQSKMGVDLDPLDPATNFHLVKNCYYARRFDQAVESGRAAIELVYDFPYTRWYVSRSLVELGAREEAWNTAVEGRSLGGRQPLNEGHFGYVAAACGYVAEAREVVRSLENRGQRAYSPGLAIAWAYLGLGEPVACLEWLERAFYQGEPYLPSIAVSPACDPIRHRPQFIDLLKRMRCIAA
jgi:DNA-binding winged helix-turn-helix (wHTH) protein